jgi:nitrogen fixation/metabolism regulation signal transduction histidine kinase
MTFRKLTFLFTALLLSSLLLIQLWLIQGLTKDVSSKIGEAAFEVSVSTIKTMINRPLKFEFTNFAVQGDFSESAQLEVLSEMTRRSNDIRVDLQDGQLDNSIAVRSAGRKYDIAIPRTGIENSLETMSNKILITALTSIVIGLIIASIFSRRLATPLKRLQQASKLVGKGEFGIQIESPHKLQSIELRETVNAFNEMSQKIEKLQLENERLQKDAQLSELTEITRGLAHTIRNPLNTLNLAIDELTSNTNKTKREELCKISKHQVTRIDKWVRSLMDIMSSDNALVEEVYLVELIQSCIDDLKVNLVDDITLRFELAPSIENNSTSILAIYTELKSLILSLINNAVESVSDAKLASESGHVDIAISYDKGSFIITINDNGKGLSEAIKAKLFSPHNTNKTYGAGMGLYLSYRVATLKYDGDLSIENLSDSDPKLHGCNVTLTLNSRV